MKLQHALTGCFLVLFNFGAIAQELPIYRWKDANGLINYGIDPPPGVDVTPIGDRGTVSVIPPPPSLTTEALAIRRENEKQKQITQLKAEIDNERRMRQSLEGQLSARRACEERYQKPCDEAGNPIESVNRNSFRRPDWYHEWWGGYPPPNLHPRPPGVRPPPHRPPGTHPPHRPPPSEIRPPSNPPRGNASRPGLSPEGRPGLVL